MEGFEGFVFLLAGHGYLQSFDVIVLMLLRLGAIGLAVSFEDCEGCQEEAAGGEGEEDDGAAVGSLGGGWCGGGVVQALGAALRVRCGSEREDCE
jgi:hypothetical protein